MKIIKRDKKSKKKKIKRENVGEIDIATCLKKINKDQKNTKKLIARLKSLNIIMNKIVF